MVTAQEFAEYNKNNMALVRSTLADMGCRPVLFVGSGMTRRYFGGPSWVELLRAISVIIGMTEDKFNFLDQKASNNPIDLGSLLADEVHEWAFGAGRNSFPADFFRSGVHKDLFIKFLASSVIDQLVVDPTKVGKNVVKEIDFFGAISPHSIITTNFDSFLESCYPDFEKVIGEKIIPFSLNIMGELYKIHGSSSDPASLILTREDYERFRKKRRYISSKMMTYFAEYPVFILGYSFNDENINSIISDLGEALRENGGLLTNVFLVKRIKNLEELSSLQTEHAVAVSDSSASLRIRTILVSDFEELYRTLGDTTNPTPIPVKTLRHLAARVVELVRSDVPKSEIDINYERIENLSSNAQELASVLGINKIVNPNLDYPYSPTTIAEKMGFGKNFNKVNRLIELASQQVGYDIKATDNDYHCKVKAGRKSYFHKYSEGLYQLLLMLRDT